MEHLREKNVEFEDWELTEEEVVDYPDIAWEIGEEIREIPVRYFNLWDRYRYGLAANKIQDLCCLCS